MNANIQQAIQGLDLEINRLTQIRQTLAPLAEAATSTAIPQEVRRGPGRPAGSGRKSSTEAGHRTVSPAPIKPKRKLSEAGRKAISEAMKARWAARLPKKRVATK